MELLLIEYGPHYAPTSYFTVQLPDNSQLQYYFDDAEITNDEYERDQTTLWQIEGRVRCAIKESGLTGFLALKSVLEGAVFDLMMPLLPESQGMSVPGMIGTAAASTANLPKLRIADPRVVTRADHEARLKREGKRKPPEPTRASQPKP